MLLMMMTVDVHSTPSLNTNIIINVSASVCMTTMTKMLLMNKSLIALCDSCGNHDEDNNDGDQDDKNDGVDDDKREDHNDGEGGKQISDEFQSSFVFLETEVAKESSMKVESIIVLGVFSYSTKKKSPCKKQKFEEILSKRRPIQNWFESC